MKRMMLVSGSSNPNLSAGISDYLQVPLIDPQMIRFANGEICCQIEKNVRGADVFVVQSICPPHVNDYLMELLIMIDALKRASANSIIAVIPNYGYARQDRKVAPRTPITAKLVADLLTVAGATRVITMDLHSGQVQGFFNIPFDNIFSSPVIISHLEKTIFQKEGSSNPVFIAPDSGGVERVRYYAKKFKSDLAMIDKRRTAPNVAKAMNVIGDVSGRDTIIIDDMIDTAGTLVEAVHALKDHGAKQVFIYATHALFSGPAFERISTLREMTKLMVTDTIPLNQKWHDLENLEILSTAEIFAKAIHHTFHDDSVSSLFT